MLSPIAPPYDALEWEAKPFPEKVKMVCAAWAVQGYGTPASVFLVYVLKVGLYIAGWLYFCGFSPGLGSLSTLPTWWLDPVAFQKAILWSLLFEILGLGCGSGPLTGRYSPPVGGFLYFLRPGATKAPLFPGAPLVGGDTRTWLDVLLYGAILAAAVRALVAPAPGWEHLWPLVLLLPLAGIGDKTVFLAARAEHYYTTVLCFAFAGNWIAGAKAVQMALWFWAGTSKLNHHFPNVVCVMMSNSPVMRFGWFRKRMYRAYPDDLRPSSLAVVMGHMGTALELSVPVVLALGDGGVVTVVGMLMMLALHGFITSSVPMGVPIEWNVMVVYGAFFLFGQNASVSLLSLGSLPLAAVLAVALVGLPLLGNLKPKWVSFLLAMRYYAGNWAFSVWLIKKDALKKLDKLKKSSAWPLEQLTKFYDRRTSVGLLGKVIAFRMMHLHGRALRVLLPKTVDRMEDYEWADGELIAGLALGWNFGEGHLHGPELLANLQRQCGFEPGELRCVFVESQPLFGSTQAYRIADAKTGDLGQGELRIDELRECQPWPESLPPTAPGQAA